MRNKYQGICYRCNKIVNKGEGHFEKTVTGWRTQHAECCIKNKYIMNSVGFNFNKLPEKTIL